MKNVYVSWVLICSLLCIGCSGGGSDEPTPSPTPTVTAPKVVSATPTNNATDIATGNVNVQIVYDKNVSINNNKSLVVSGGKASISGTPSVSDKTLSLTINCPDYETKVTLTVPAGYVYITGATADEYTLSFTTAKEPATPAVTSSLVAGTTDQVKKLYAYFIEQYGQKTISSVMADVNWNHKIADKVNALTGKYPAMNCYDFIHIYVPENNWINYNDITPVTEWTDAGGIVQLMWHFNVPVNESTTPGTDGSGVTCSPSETTFRASNALVSGTWENKWFYQEMDKVIAVILKLQDAGIAATWRPFHEAAGNATYKQQASWTKSWFWWGYDGADTFKKLWIDMFDYFKQKGVKNLIWIWTTQNYNGNSTSYNLDSDWYPGDNYVDMVARDLYGYTAAQNNQEFTEIQALYPSKMIALGECGWGNNKTPEQGLISDCWTVGAKWNHFMVWYDGSAGNSTTTMCTDAWWKDAMQNSSVITRDKLPELK